MVQYECPECLAQFPTMPELHDHFRTHVNDMVLQDRIPLMEQALNHALRVVTFFAHGDQKTGLRKFCSEKTEEILQYLMAADGKGTAGVKWYLLSLIHI